MDKTPPRFGLLDYKKHPQTVLLIISINIIWGLLLFITNRSDDNTENAYRLLDEHKERADKFENLVFEYTRAIMFKDAQIKNRDVYIDSLKRSQERETLPNICDYDR